jgi:hypothetical protein
MKTFCKLVMISTALFYTIKTSGNVKMPIRTKQFIERSNVDVKKMEGLDNVVLIEGAFGEYKLKSSVWLKRNDFKYLKEVWMVYTEYSKTGKFNQEQLNNKRVEELLRLFPSLENDTNIKWDDLVINGINSADSAKNQFHGFVLVFKYPGAEPTLGNVLERHRDWDSIIVVADVTTSMLPWLEEVMVWLDRNMSKTRIDRFVYFNDGDGIADNSKVIGRTGGVHSDTSKKYTSYIQGVRKYLVMGIGNIDNEENVLEALIEAQKHVGPGSQLILLADNFSTPRDTALIDSLHFPVKVIACGALQYDLNPSLVNIAYRTKGSIHTGLNDVKDFKNGWKPTPYQPNLVLNKRFYSPRGRQMECKNCVGSFN